MNGEQLPHEAYLAALAALERVGPARLRWLLSLGGPEQVWHRLRSGRLPAAPQHLGLDAEQVRGWQRRSGELDPAELWQRCVRHHVGVVALGAAGYPPALATDPDPPVVLFHLGDPDVIRAPMVAVVGTRRATGYGLRVAARLGEHLSAAGVSVVSGLALGIDAAAHRGALGTRGAAPVAVVGGGLHAPCPSRNRDLARAIVERGVILSEVPTGVEAARWRFPVRNRILAALADAVVVVESPTRGGSMHTVAAALERDVPVLAVPGPIDSRASEGAIDLIVDGAMPCRGVEDVLRAIGAPLAAAASANAARTSELSTSAPGEAGRDEGTDRPNLFGPAPERRVAPRGAAAAVLDALEWRPSSLEQLARRSGLPMRELSAAIGQLERSGWVRCDGTWVERVARSSTVRDLDDDHA